MHPAAHPLTRASRRLVLAAAVAVAAAADAFARAAMREAREVFCSCAPLPALAPEYTRAAKELTHPWRGVTEQPPLQRPGTYG